MRSTVALRKRHLGLLAVVACFGFGAAASDLQPRAGAWRPVGPYGGSVGAIAVAPSNPRVLYVCGAGAVFRSADGGITWSSRGTVAPVGAYDPAAVGPVGPIAVSPANPDTVFVGFGRRGVFRSDDGGATWRDASAGLPIVDLIELLSLAVDPFDPNVLIAALSGQGIYRSADGGKSWAQVVGPEPRAYYIDAVFNSLVPGRVYAAASSLWSSADHGARWEMVASLPFQVAKLAVGPEPGGVVYAIDLRKIYLMSLESGVWRDLSPGLPLRLVDALAVDPARPGVLYVAGWLQSDAVSAIYESADAGAHWRELGRLRRGAQVSDLRVDPSGSGILWVIDGDRGFYVRYPGVDSLEMSSRGLHATWVADLARDPFDPDRLYAAALGAGFFRSCDGGMTWQRRDVSFPWDRVTSVLPALATPGTLYIGTRGSGPSKSEDAGENWISIAGGVLGEANAVAVDPRSSQTIFALGERGLWKTTDGGATWAQRSALVRSYGDGAAKVLIDPRVPNEVYALGGRVFKSTDAGETWNESGAGLPYAPYPCDPESCPDRVWALALDPFRPNVLYAATEYHGVWVSEDRAATWKAAGPVESKTRSIIADPARPGTLYVGTAGKGVFRSTDFGSTWSPLGEGLGPADVWSLAIHASGERVFAGTAGAGVFVLDVTRAPRRALRFLTPGSRTELLVPRN